MNKTTKIGIGIIAFVILSIAGIFIYKIFELIDAYSPTYNHLEIGLLKNKEIVYINYIIPGWMNGKIIYQISNSKEIAYDDTYYDSTSQSVLIIEQELEPLYYFISNDTLTFFVQSNSRVYDNLRNSGRTKIVVKEEPYQMRHDNYDQRPLVRLDKVLIELD